MMICIGIFSIYYRSYEDKVDKITISCSDYTIIVKNLPKKDYNEPIVKVITDFFNKEAEKVIPGLDKYVHKVNLIYNIDELIAL